VDFANFQRRIHSLLRANGTLPVQTLNGHHSLMQADGTLPVQIRDGAFGRVGRYGTGYDDAASAVQRTTLDASIRT
jgi:hypothetical protein